MTNEEANKVLEEMNEVRPEKLNDKAKRLFEAMMKIADERDSVKADLYEANNRINDLLDLVKQKDKRIAVEEIQEQYFISKDKIKEILEIEEKIDNEKLLSLLQTIVDENARLEEIEELDEWITRRDGEVTQQEGKRLEMCHKINELVKRINYIERKII